MKQQFRSGFTLVELIMTVMFLFIVASFSVIFGMRAIAIQELDSARDTTMSELALSRERAMGATNDKAWGVQFATSSITSFRGSSYASRDTAFDRTTSFASEVRISGASSIVFFPPDGRVQTTGVVNFVNGSATASVSVNELGGIEVH